MAKKSFITEEFGSMGSSGIAVTLVLSFFVLIGSFAVTESAVFLATGQNTLTAGLYGDAKIGKPPPTLTPNQQKDIDQRMQNLDNKMKELEQKQKELEQKAKELEQQKQQGGGGGGSGSGGSKPPAQDKDASFIGDDAGCLSATGCSGTSGF